MDSQSHRLHNHVPAPQRLKSRRSFLHSVKSLEPNEDVEEVRLQLCEESLQRDDNTLSQPSLRLNAGCHETWPRWRCLNRLKAQGECCKASLIRWGIKTDDSTCDCVTVQKMMDHALQCPDLPQIRSIADLMACIPVAVSCIDRWTGKL